MWEGRMKKMFQYKRIYLLALAPISLILIILARKSSYFAEQIYARHIYKWLSQIISTITGLFPFSLAEILLLLSLVLFPILLIRFIGKLIKNREHRRRRIFLGSLNILCLFSLTIFLFTILGGLNYYRHPFSQYSGLDIRESSVEELFMLTESLTLQANQLREQIPKTDDEGVFQLSMSTYKLAEIAKDAFNKLAEDYPILKGKYGRPKPILLSSLLTRTEITGIFIPFTMEANVNVHVSDYSIPATMLHEMAHLRGVMREDEANFISYIAGMKSDNVEMQYSSTMLALISSSNALYDQDVDLYFKIRDLYGDGVRKDIKANSEFWAKYDDTVISTISNKINDTYLKANAQADGVKSYGRMVDLLLALYREENLVTE